MQSMAGPSMMEDGDNRSRNAKAQRRHREKRKAHLKSLEDTVAVLQAQLDDARRQLGAAAYANAGRFSPGSKDMAQMAAENAYLRSENADLRRQLYGGRPNYGGPSNHIESAPSSLPPPQMMDHEVKDNQEWSGEVKHEYPSYAQTVVGSSPRVPHSRQEPPEPNSGPSSSTSSYPQLDHFGNPVGQPRVSTASSTRSRMMSASSNAQAPAASPYVASASFNNDSRGHMHSSSQSHPSQPQTPHHAPVDGRYPPPVRYESTVYPQQPPPHSMPRSSIYHSPVDTYRPEGDMHWGPEAGPPPFPGQVPYVGQYDSSQPPPPPPQEEWRPDAAH